MCSCYVASRNSDSKEEENNTTIKPGNTRDNLKQFINSSENEDKRILIMDSESTSMVKKKSKSINASSNGLQVEPATLKSNLKRSASLVEMNHEIISQGMRKVSWSDAHGKDIAHVQEFEPSEEGEIGGVRNSCKCTIQ